MIHVLFVMWKYVLLVRNLLHLDATFNLFYSIIPNASQSKAPQPSFIIFNALYFATWPQGQQQCYLIVSFAKSSLNRDEARHDLLITASKTLLWCPLCRFFLINEKSKIVIVIFTTIFYRPISVQLMFTEILRGHSKRLFQKMSLGEY